MANRKTPGRVQPKKHAPYDPDIAEAMRERRQELGLSMAQMAKLAGVSDQTWGNYETGRTQVRGDKQPQVWDALGWELPDWQDLVGPTPFDDILTDVFPSLSPEERNRRLRSPGLAGDPEIIDAVRQVLAEPEVLGEFMAEDANNLGIPPWDEIPTALSAAYSPLLASTLGEKAARCFALGAMLYDQALEENLDELAHLPRGTHLGELDESHIGDALPSLWLTRYDYEFVFQLRGLGRDLAWRLYDGAPAPAEPLVRTMAEALVVHDIFTLGSLAALRDVTVDDDEWEGWVDALSGPDQPAHRLISCTLAPPSDAPEHIDNWFRALERPFVPDWHGAASTGSDDGATVTSIHTHR